MVASVFTIYRSLSCFLNIKKDREILAMLKVKFIKTMIITTLVMFGAAHVISDIVLAGGSGQTYKSNGERIYFTGILYRYK